MPKKRSSNNSPKCEESKVLKKVWPANKKVNMFGRTKWNWKNKSRKKLHHGSHGFSRRESASVDFQSPNGKIALHDDPPPYEAGGPSTSKVSETNSAFILLSGITKTASTRISQQKIFSFCLKQGKKGRIHTERCLPKEESQTLMRRTFFLFACAVEL